MVLRMWHGFFNSSFSSAIWGGLLFSHITIISVTVFLHRCQAHRSLELHSSVSHFFRFWLWLTTGMITKRWVAVHRKHHAAAETQEDPHSPVIYGLNRVLWNGVGLYRNESKKPDVVSKYGHGTPNDWLEHNVYTPGHRVGFVVMLFIDIFLFGYLGLLSWAIQMLWIPFFAAGVINGVGHYFGYRNFEVPDNSRNIFPIGFLIGGEELHNNHHAYGSSAKLSVKWYEFDYGWFIIQTLAFFNLAKVKRTIPKLDNATKKSSDGYIEHLLYNKIQLFERYCRNVIKPVFKSDGVAKYFPRARYLMIKEMSSISIADSNRLKKLLESYHNLKVVYDFRKRLEDICKTKKSSFADVSASLLGWCQNAQESGVAELCLFADWLESFIHQERQLAQ